MILITAIITVSFIFSFLISYVFISMYVYKERKKIWYDSFSYVFSLSNIMLLSMILEIANIGDP